MPNDSQFMDILIREFERIRKDDPNVGRTYAEMAQYVGIPASTFSHYRSGNRAISKANAEGIAASLRPAKDQYNDEQRAELANELLAARVLSTENQVAAEDWLKSIGKDGHLLFVEFRDFPSARSSNPNKEVARDMAKAAGQAVANGLVYALLNPFPIAYEKNSEIPNALRSYFGYLTDAITDTYTNILGEAYRQIWKTHKDDAGKRDEAFGEIRERLRVYRRVSNKEHSTGPLEIGPGIGYKVFYHRENVAKPGELWYWLSTPDGETLARNSKGEVERLAIECGFYPLLECTESLMDRGKNRLPDDEYLTAKAKAKGRKSLWEVVEIIESEMNKMLIEDANPEAKGPSA